MIDLAQLVTAGTVEVLFDADFAAELARLRADNERLTATLELVAGNLLAAEQKRSDAPCSAASHTDEATEVARPFAPRDRFSDAARAIRAQLPPWCRDSSSHKSHAIQRPHTTEDRP